MYMAVELSPDELTRIIAKLEESGYIIKRKGKGYIKKTLDVEQDLWEQVDEVRRADKITVRDVVSEALTQWLARRRNR